MHVVRFLLYLLYATYLTYAGLLFLVVPWSPVWTRIVINLQPSLLADILGMPAVRGGLSGFGLLHLLFALFEMKSGNPEE